MLLLLHFYSNDLDGICGCEPPFCHEVGDYCKEEFQCCDDLECHLANTHKVAKRTCPDALLYQSYVTEMSHDKTHLRFLESTHSLKVRR
jgi:hypothetical protein